MKKTDTFFIIDNYNHDPSELLEYCKNYIIYDASTDEIKAKGLNYKKVKRTGHNISSYFDFFYENYDSLPDFMCLTKGHMIGRHCTKAFFDRVYDNKYFTYLYSQQENERTNPPVSMMAMENVYLEKNNSWYVNSKDHPHRYFDDLNRLLRFIYENPVLPEYCSFAPGACYIVSKAQVLKNPRNFYRNMNRLMSYALEPNFPSEAHMVERILPIIFTANYKMNKYIYTNDGGGYEAALKKEEQITASNEKMRKTFTFRIKRRIGLLQ